MRIGCASSQGAGAGACHGRREAGTRGAPGCMALGPGQIPGSPTLTVDALAFESEPPGLVVTSDPSGKI